MKTPKYISFILAAAAIMFSASISQAQVTSTAMVTLTVVPAPGMSMTTVQMQSRNPGLLASGESSKSQAMVFRSSQNVMVRLNSADRVTSKFDLQLGQVKTITAKQLKGISKVEIVYLGS